MKQLNRAIVFFGIGLFVAMAVAESALSNAFRLETRTSVGAQVAFALEHPAFTADGTTTGQIVVAGASGDGLIAPIWDTWAYTNGWYDLALVARTNVAFAQVIILNGAYVAVREGRLRTDTMWSSNAIHVVRCNVVVPSGKTLTLGPDSIVKFTENACICIENGGGLDAQGVVLTHSADDAAGGDTDLNGVQVVPSSRVWLTGSGVPDVTCTTFDTQGGESALPRIYSAGSAYRWLPVPHRSGAVFAGWHTAAGQAGAPVTEASIVPSGMPVTLFAHWRSATIMPLDVVFDAQGGTVTPPSTTVTNGFMYGNLPVPERRGYVFNGWWIDDVSGAVRITETTPVLAPTNHILSARWTLRMAWVLSQNTGTFFARLALTNATSERISGVWFAFQDRWSVGHTNATILQSVLWSSQRHGVVTNQFAEGVRYVDLMAAVSNALVAAGGDGVWDPGETVAVGVSEATLAQYAINSSLSVASGNERLLEMYDRSRQNPVEFVDLSEALRYRIAGSDRIVTNQSQLLLSHTRTESFQQTTSRGVPYAWLIHYGVVNANNYEAAALTDSDGDGFTAEQEYAAGTDPTNQASVFHARISITNGVLFIAWDPDLGTTRVYTVEGKATLMDRWGPTNAMSRFFRIKVSEK